jgi:hypothetical protein
MLLGVFEGANSPDFMDALPLYIITEKGIIGTVSHADVNCSKGFRYVRYIGPADARCNVAELEFYGHPGEGDLSRPYHVTNLPTVSIHTQDGVIPYDKEHQIVSQLTIVSDQGLLQEMGMTRERGNASRGFPKKPYRIKFDQKQRVLDAPSKAKKWTLINNYGDKTLMRNLLAFELSRRLGMPYTPYGTAVDVLLNGGNVDRRARTASVRVGMAAVDRRIAHRAVTEKAHLLAVRARTDGHHLRGSCSRGR